MNSSSLPVFCQIKNMGSEVNVSVKGIFKVESQVMIINQFWIIVKDVQVTSWHIYTRIKGWKDQKELQYFLENKYFLLECVRR